MTHNQPDLRGGALAHAGDRATVEAAYRVTVVAAQRCHDATELTGEPTDQIVARDAHGRLVTLYVSWDVRHDDRRPCLQWDVSGAPAWYRPAAHSDAGA